MRIKAWVRRYYLAAWVILSLAWPIGLVGASTLEAVTEDSSYSYLENGQVVGPATAVVTATLERAGLLDYHLAVYPWARAYDLALAEPNVLIYPLMRTPEREENFKWIGEFEEIKSVLYKLRWRADLNVQQLNDARAWNTGVVRDDVREQYLRDAGFSRLVVSASPMDNFRKLLNGQVDTVPLSPRDARRFCEQLGVPFRDLEALLTLDQITAHAYLAFSKQTPDAVVERTTAAFEQLKQEGQVARLMLGR
jgi:polar amino acid transport system substrate-binding protein